MDNKKTSATASSNSGKHGEKKDENFLTKTAHSIRDKVHEFTDDVKEKTHNLTHSSDSKKNKKNKDPKKTDTKPKASPKPATAGKKDSGSDSDDEDDSPKPPPPHAALPAKKDNERDANKSDTAGSKPSRAATAAAAAEKKDTTPSTSSRIPSTKPASGDSANRSFNDHKDAASAAPSSSSKPSGDSSAPKPSGVRGRNDPNPSGDSPAPKPSSARGRNDPNPSTDKLNKPTEGGDATKKPLSSENTNDQIHISFDGVSTVDDLLERIDDAIEKAKIVVDNAKGPIGLSIGKATPAPTPSPADLEKKPIEKATDGQNKVEAKKGGDQKEEDEPIRLNYNEIHNMDDLLRKVDQQPGKRKVVLENVPGNSSSITVQKQVNPPPTTPPTSATSSENDDSSEPRKSILKTSQDPSSLDTSTKTASFQDDQIHLNIEGVQSVDDLLDRVEDVVEQVPVVIDTKSQGEKRQAPQAPNSNDNNNQLAKTTVVQTQKRDAPKAPSSTSDQINNTLKPTNKQEEDDKTSSSSSIEEKKDDEGKNDWI